MTTPTKLSELMERLKRAAWNEQYNSTGHRQLFEETAAALASQEALLKRAGEVLRPFADVGSLASDIKEKLK